MTTKTTVTVIDHTSDAGFQTWVGEFINMLTSVGLVQTADTGQINPATVLRPAVNTLAGYAIFRMNDSQQSAAPVFIKLQFGTGSVAAVPRVDIQLGTASNGSGTLSGLGSAFTDTLAGAGVAISSTITTRTSYACAVDGAFWISWKIGANGNTGAPSLAFFYLSRYTDSTGAPTSAGISTIYGNSSTVLGLARSFNYTTSANFTAANMVQIGGQNAWAVTSSLVSGTPQAYQLNYITPRVQPHNFAAWTILAEAAIGVQFQATLTGSTTRNYIQGVNANAGPLNALGLIWE